MKKFFGILSLVMALTFAVTSCGGDAPVNADSAERKCCASKDSCEHKSDSTKHAACANKEAKKCCKKDSAKSCSTSVSDSATCAAMKEKCAKECGTDSICEMHKAECKAKCEAKGDSTSVNSCAPNCDKPCCSGEEKKACGPNCEESCCAKK